jgi:dnd system-associated protein 4
MESTLKKGVNRSKKWADLVKKYVHDNHPHSGRGLFETIKDLMYFCALLGYDDGNRTPLEVYKEYGVDDIQAHIFTNDKNVGIIFAIALVEEKSASIFKEEKEEEMIQIFEEYANRGFEILEQWQNASDNTGEDSLMSGLLSNGFFEVESESDGDEFENFTLE